MRLSSGDYPDDPFVIPHSRIHCEESFLNDIILNLTGFDNHLSIALVYFFRHGFKMIVPQTGGMQLGSHLIPLTP